LAYFSLMDRCMKRVDFKGVIRQLPGNAPMVND
jgi:hypothetical protein